MEEGKGEMKTAGSVMVRTVGRSAEEAGAGHKSVRVSACGCLREECDQITMEAPRLGGSRYGRRRL